MSAAEDRADRADRPANGTDGAGGSPAAAGEPSVAALRTRALNEDWLATVVGLALLALVLLGAIPGWVVP